MWVEIINKKIIFHGFGLASILGASINSIWDFWDMTEKGYCIASEPNQVIASIELGIMFFAFIYGIYLVKYIFETERRLNNETT
jgi:hypothetical protein